MYGFDCPITIKLMTQLNHNQAFVVQLNQQQQQSEHPTEEAAVLVKFKQ
jgi:hypothetical protein